MRVQVRKCPFTGKIFEEKDIEDYKLHLMIQRKYFQEERKLKRIKDTFADWLKQERAQIKNIEDIVPWFLENQQHIMDAHTAMCNSPFDDKFYEGDVYENLTFVNISYSGKQSNTHVCPDNGVTNWGGNVNDAPRGYPGWRIRVKGTLKRGPKGRGYPYGNGLNLVGIKTGTGGGGNDDWSYDATIFLDDWTGLIDSVHEMALIEDNERYIRDQETIVKRLKGTRF